MGVGSSFEPGFLCYSVFDVFIFDHLIISVFSVDFILYFCLHKSVNYKITTHFKFLILLLALLKSIEFILWHSDQVCFCSVWLVLVQHYSL